MDQFRRRAGTLLASRDHADEVAQVFAALYRVIWELGWGGACHATTAIAHLNLDQVGVPTIPCVGEASLEEILGQRVAFDHSWNEIDGLPYDVAISNPLEQIGTFRSSGVLAGIEMGSGRPTLVKYGIATRMGFDGDAQRVATMSLGEFMQLPIPLHPESAEPLWRVCADTARCARIAFDISAGKMKAESSHWVVRP